MAKCKKMAVGGPAGPAGPSAMGAAKMDPRAAAMMAAKRKQMGARPGAAMPPGAAGAPAGQPTMMKKGGAVKKCAKGGGIESKGKTKGKIV